MPTEDLCLKGFTHINIYFRLHSAIRQTLTSVTLFRADQVKYWRKYDDPEPGANRVFVPGNVNQTRLENMLPDSHYLIEVRAYNGAGFGPPGEHCEMFTRRPRKSNKSQCNDIIQCTTMYF